MVFTVQPYLPSSRASTRLKPAIPALAAPMGLHGAFYAFRRELFVELRDDTLPSMTLTTGEG